MFSKIFVVLICMHRTLTHLSFVYLYPNENEISLYMITPCFNIQVKRIKEVITEDRMACYLDKFSLLVS